MAPINIMYPNNNNHLVQGIGAVTTLSINNSVPPKNEVETVIICLQKSEASGDNEAKTGRLASIMGGAEFFIPVFMVFAFRILALFS